VMAGLPVEKSPVSVPGHFRKDAAMRGLLLSRGVSKPAKTVGVHLIDCCALNKGVYEVGLATVSGRLQLSERSVRRAVAELDSLGLIARDVHAGRNHINGYRPDWEALARAASLPAKPARTGETGQTRPKVSANTESLSPTYSSVKKPQRVREVDHRQRQMPLPVVVQGGKPHASQGAIAREHANVRLGTAYRERLHQLGEAAGRELKGSVTAEDWESGVVAEMAKRGSGLQAMLDAGFIRWSAETKPPSAATG